MQSAMDTQTTPRYRTISDPRFGAACQVLEEAIAKRAFPGCAFGVLAEDKVLLQDARGRFTYEESSSEVTSATVFDLASVSKVLATTAIAMLLYQRDQFDIDKKLGDLLPEFLSGRARNDRAREVTLRHLLAHNSGLPAYVEFFRTASTAAELVAACMRLSLEAEPGSRGEYSDPGFILLGKALEACMHEPLDVFVQREVFKPLGMDATCFCPPPVLHSSISPTEVDATFRRRRIQGEVQDENAWLLGGVAGHAGLFSNVADVLRFAAEVIESTVMGSAKSSLFQASTIDVFKKRQGPADSSRALGWDTPSAGSSSGHYFSSRSIGHLGYSGCSLWIDLDARIAVALLTNRTWPDRKSQLIRQVRPAFHDAVRRAL
jgi:CubicO group peptidase (beta-lactamase class C family)